MSNITELFLHYFQQYWNSHHKIWGISGQKSFFFSYQICKKIRLAAGGINWHGISKSQFPYHQYYSSRRTDLFIPTPLGVTGLTYSHKQAFVLHRSMPIDNHNTTRFPKWVNTNKFGNNICNYNWIVSPPQARKLLSLPCKIPVLLSKTILSTPRSPAAYMWILSRGWELKSMESHESCDK